MQELVVDNGVEFHSVSLENACLSLGTEIHYCERKTPWHKGKVERFIKTLNNAVSHGTPGTTFSNILEKGDYDPSKHAVVRLSKIQEIVRKWIVDVYHQRPHRAIGVPPELDWTSSIRDEDILLPDDPAVLDAILGRTETRKLTHKGIELDCLLYNSPELSDLRRRYGEKLEVELRIDDSNIGEIIVVCPKTGDLYRVPSLQADYATGLSRWQHAVCKSYSRRKFKKSNWESWLKAKHDIVEMVREEFLTTGKGTRSRAARFKNAGNGSATPFCAPEPELQADTHIEETVLSVDDNQAGSVIEYEPITPVYRVRDSAVEEVI